MERTLLGFFPWARDRVRAAYVPACTLLCSIANLGPATAAPVEANLERRVLLVVDRPNDPLLERIRAEVAALGLGVFTRSSVGPLEDDAREQRAVAAIRVLPSRKGVEVWMADATTGRTLARQLVVDERPQGPDLGLVALQTAEILRTGLFPSADATRKDTAPPAKPPEPPVTPPAAYAALPHAHETTALAGFGGLYSPGGAGPALQLGLSLQRALWRRLGVAFEVNGTVRRATLSGPEGDAQVAAYVAGIVGFASFPAEESPWFLTTGIGAGVVNMHSKGRVSPDYPSLEATSNSVVAAAAIARIDAGWKPARWTRIGLAGLAGTTFGRTTIRLAGNQAGDWGTVFLAVLLVVGADWEW
jgi:hypothetical protein